MIETVGDLIAQLEGYNEDARVVLAVQPSWPMTHTIKTVEMGPDGVVYVAQGEQVSHLDQDGHAALGW